MNAITIKRHARVELPTSEQYDNIVAFQLVTFSYNFYGSLQSDTIDTKIMADGRQIVIDGNGFIKAGTEI